MLWVKRAFHFVDFVYSNVNVVCRNKRFSRIIGESALMIPTGVSVLHLLLVGSLIIREAVDTAHHIGCAAPSPDRGDEYGSYYYYSSEVQALIVAREATDHFVLAGGSVASLVILVCICCCCRKREGKKREAKIIVLK